MDTKRLKKPELVAYVLSLAMDLGVDELRNVERRPAAGALLDAEEWINLGTPRGEVVEELATSSEYRRITKADWEETMMDIEDRRFDLAEAARKRVPPPERPLPMGPSAVAVGTDGLSYDLEG